MSKSEFARRQLKKHGWTEGSGLGKDEHGRSDPIKVSLKMDKAGVGHDPGKEFTDHWWLRVFNEAAQKIGNKDKKSKSNSTMSEEEKAQSIKEQRRKNFYKGFVQSTTLTNGVEEKTVSSDSSDEDEKDTSNTVSVPTLEDIHKFCGGATGHKAASFGIRMEGKIKRASHHEKQFEEKAKRNELNDETAKDSSENTCSNLERGVKKKKKKKKEKEAEAELNEGKKAQKRKAKDSNLGDETKDSETEAAPRKKSKKKKMKSESNVSESGIPDTSEHMQNTSNSDKNSDDVEQKMKVKDNSQEQDGLEDINKKCSNSSKKKKKKKKKSHE